MKKIKRAAIWAIFIIFATSMTINISNQFSILVKAKEKNQNLKNETKELTETNKKLERQIEFATDSAFIEETKRDKFGMGTEDDYWIR